MAELRRASSTGQGASLPIPAPPPLPPPRYSDVAKSVLDRLRYGSRRSASHSTSQVENADHHALLSQRFGPSSSQSTSHKTGLKIRALDINQSRTHVVLAGGKILKTVRVDDAPSCSEDFNIRAAAVNYAWENDKDETDVSQQQQQPANKSFKDAQDLTSVHRETFDIEDVAWSRDNYKDYIATAASNGKIILYNLRRPGVEVARLHEHYRQVHKVDFNPMEGAFLLSGSQDGTVRMWDLRVLSKDVMMSASQHVFPGRSDGVRHVKWSPRNTWSFAFGTDNGTIQRWDTRYSKRPVLKISAHFETCNSIDWHPDGKHIVSAGKDQNVKVWNVTGEGVRQKAVFSFRTPREVQNVRWRPSCFGTDENDQSVKQCMHLATSYKTYPVVHVWDLRRAHMPFREIHHRVNSGTTDMLWRSRDLLWLVGPEGEFTQTDVPFVSNTVNYRPLSTFDTAPDGSLTFFAKERPDRHKTALDTRAAEPFSPYDHGRSRARKLVFGRSPGDDSVDEHFLGVPISRNRRSRAASTWSARSVGNTPPSNDEMAKMVTADLEATMRVFETFHASQVPKSGMPPGAISAPIFSYLAQKYKALPKDTAWTIDVLLDVQKLFDRNAVYVERASLYREAQTWRILGHQVWKEIDARASINRKRRLKSVTRFDNVVDKDTLLTAQGRNHSQDLVSKDSSEANHIKPMLTNKHLMLHESTSNAPTPIVRPVNQHNTREGGYPVDHLDDLELSPSLMRFQTPIKLALPSGAADSSENQDTIKAKDNLRRTALPSQQDQRKALSLLSDWKAQPRTPLTFDTHFETSHGISVPQRLHRHDSVGSFMLFSASSSSKAKASAGDSFASDLLDNDDSLPEKHYFGRNDSDLHSSNGSARGHSLENPSSYRHESELTDMASLTEQMPAMGNLQPELSHEDLPSKIGGESHPSNPFSVGDMDQKEGAYLNYGEMDDYGTSISPSAQWNNTDSSSSKANESSLPKANARPMPHFEESFSDLASFDSVEKDVKSIPQAPTISLKPDGAPPTLVHNVKSAPAVMNPYKTAEDNSQSSDYIVSDFLSNIQNKTDEADCLDSLISAKDMLKELLTWYASKSNAQMAAHLFLLTAPLLAPASPRIQAEITEKDHTYNSYYHEFTAHLSLQHDTATEVLSTHHASINSLSLSPLFIESILTTYHEHLQSLRLLVPATSLRRLAHPSFPGVYDSALKDVTVFAPCPTCKSSLHGRLVCQACHTSISPCPICEQSHSPYRLPFENKKKRPAAITNTPTVNLWSTCAICNHSSHAACAYAWFNDVSTTPSPSPPAAATTTTSGQVAPPVSVQSFQSSTKLDISETALAPTAATEFFDIPNLENAINDVALTSSGGACPYPACFCDCAPGYYRDVRRAQLAAASASASTSSAAAAAVTASATKKDGREGASSREKGTINSPSPGSGVGGSGSVRRDSWSIGESRAVGRVRGTLRKGSLSGGDNDVATTGPGTSPNISAGPGAGGSKDDNATDEMGASGRKGAGTVASATLARGTTAKPSASRAGPDADNTGPPLRRGGSLGPESVGTASSALEPGMASPNAGSSLLAGVRSQGKSRSWSEGGQAEAEVGARRKVRLLLPARELE